MFSKMLEDRAVEAFEIYNRMILNRYFKFHAKCEHQATVLFQ